MSRFLKTRAHGGLSPLRIMMIYSLFGGLWIIFSDRIIESLVQDTDTLTELQTAKGWLFVAFTALVIYFLTRRYARALSASMRALQESEGRHAFRTLHDELTGLPNRTSFLNLLDERIMRCREARVCPFAVFYLDLYRFKVVNESLGHLIGDRLLNSVADRLREVLTPRHVLARLGGDEFAVLVTDTVTGQDVSQEVERVAELVKDALRAPFHLDGRDISVSSSLGVVICGDEYDLPEHILRDADTAVHRAKELGPDRMVVFKPGLHAEVMRTLELESYLRRGLARSEFSMRYQPVMALDDLSCVGLEALIRWRREGVIVEPSEFIHLAEDTGLILEIGRLALRQASLETVALGFPPRFISVNLSGWQVMQPDFLDVVDQILAETGADPRGLKLEITESQAMENAVRIIEILGRLRERGFGLAIDDFGTGYSSLSYLRRFPIDTLKIDQSFIRDMENSPENQRISQAVVSLAHGLGLKVVAEGVETEEQRRILLELGCEYGQGFLFSQALEPGEVAEWLRAAAGSDIRRTWTSPDAAHDRERATVT